MLGIAEAAAVGAQAAAQGALGVVQVVRHPALAHRELLQGGTGGGLGDVAGGFDGVFELGTQRFGES